MKKIMIIIFFIFLNLTYSKEAYIASFNVLRLGENKKDYVHLAKIISNFDLVGLVEVMNRKGIQELVDALNKETKEKWDYHLSPHSVGKSSYKEYYGYVYKRNSVKLIKKGKFYPNLENKFSRSPYGTTFKIGEFDFTLVMSHSVYGKSKTLRRVEAFNYDEVYDYFQELEKEEQDILIAGDFNLVGNDEGFDQLINGHKDDIVYGIDPRLKTTVGTNKLVNSYDNIFISKKYTKEFEGKSGVYNFINKDFLESRKWISDHLPVFIIVNTTEDDD